MAKEQRPIFLSRQYDAARCPQIQYQEVEQDFEKQTLAGENFAEIENLELGSSKSSYCHTLQIKDTKSLFEVRHLE